MEIDFQFTDFDNTDAIESFVTKRFQNIKRRLDSRYHSANVVLRGSIVARNNEGHGKMFLAEVAVRLPKHPTPFIVKKTEPDFRSAVTEAVTAMEGLLEKDSDKRAKRRKSGARVKIEKE